MPNANYVKGRRQEYKLVNQAKKMGCVAFRSAGSHSPIDVVAIDTAQKRISLIQAKPDTMSENAKNKLKEENIDLNGVFEVEFLVI